MKQISTDKREKYFAIARRVAQRKSRDEKDRKVRLRQERLKNQQKRIDLKQRKEERKEMYRKKLETQAKKEGIWVKTEEVDQKTTGLNNTKKRQLIRNQILFHSKLLKSKIPSKATIRFQQNNKQITTDKMLDNLKNIILATYTQEVPDIVVSINNSVESVVPTNKAKGKKRSTRIESRKNKNTQKAKASTQNKMPVKVSIQKSFLCSGIYRQMVPWVVHRNFG